MIRIQRRWLIRLAIPLVAVLAVLVWAIDRSRNVVALENRSGQAIPLLEVTRGGETKHFHDVPPGAEVSAKTRERGPFTVDGRLANGTLIRARFGDVEARVELTILPDGQLTWRKRKE
jgi:hypothetical protein